MKEVLMDSWTDKEKKQSPLKEPDIFPTASFCFICLFTEKKNFTLNLRRMLQFKCTSIIVCALKEQLSF